MGRWKGVRFGAAEPFELYDLSVDIHEDRDVSKQHPEIVAKIETFLKKARTESKIWKTVDHWPANKEKN